MEKEAFEAVIKLKILSLSGWVLKIVQDRKIELWQKEEKHYYQAARLRVMWPQGNEFWSPQEVGKRKSELSPRASTGKLISWF